MEVREHTPPRQRAARVDMHCHSAASQLSRLGVQRAAGLPECATAPEEVYELAKRRGMDFVTITDHDTIAGVLEISARPDVFISEELTAHFRGEPQAVHVLCYGISVEDHEWLLVQVPAPSTPVGSGIWNSLRSKVQPLPGFSSPAASAASAV